MLADFWMFVPTKFLCKKMLNPLFYKTVSNRIPYKHSGRSRLHLLAQVRVPFAFVPVRAHTPQSIPIILLQVDSAKAVSALAAQLAKVEFIGPASLGIFL